MNTIIKWLIMSAAVLVGSCNVSYAKQSNIPSFALKERATLTREAQFVYGINAPIPMLAAEIEQESGWRPNITASDGGMGLGQFMAGTVKQIVRSYPELGPANPYNPTWAIRAQSRFIKWNYTRVKGKNNCERFGATLKGYNAGLGYPQRAQKKSSDPYTWFTLTENINPGQSYKNFIYSRWYPREILFVRQKKYTAWGFNICDINHPPYDTYPR